MILHSKLVQLAVPVLVVFTLYSSLGIALGVIPVLAADTTDVTAKVSAAVKENKLVIQASNGTFGDTAPGVPKKLSIEYRLGDQKMEKEVGENGQIEIAASAGQKLVITKAVYGPADGSKPVDLENAAEVLETLPGFTIEHVLKIGRAHV